MTVKFIPDGFATVTPYLIIRDASSAIEFYKTAFNAVEIKRMEHDGKIMHADITIGESHIMLADEFPEMNFKSPQAYGGSSICIHLYVENADHQFQKAVDAGAKIIKPLANEFFGDRHGIVEDPFGYLWAIATHIEDVSIEELKKRMSECFLERGRE